MKKLYYFNAYGAYFICELLAKTDDDMLIRIKQINSILITWNWDISLATHFSKPTTITLIPLPSVTVAPLTQESPLVEVKTFSNSNSLK